MLLLKRICYLFFVTLTIFIVSCNKKNVLPNNTLQEQNILNVAYGNNSLQTMDIYLPAGRDTIHTKLLLLIHGGAWTSGDKADFDTAITTLKTSLPNYVIANINYRLASIQGTDLWPTQLNDVQQAYQFILQQSNKYVFNKKQVAAFGASAGAQLALLLGYTINNNIKAVIDLFGPTDLAALYYNAPNPYYPSLLSIFLNGTPVTNPASYTSASPLFFATNTQIPPTIIFHGTADDVVPISQSDSLNNRLNNLNVYHEYIQYQGAGHGWTGNNLIDTYSKSIQFLQKIMPN